ncbi:MAG: hotdog family protein [Xanthomonadales bacterium]|nr:hotdog family protein [Xanthomonadales bacterium]MCE7931442.1 3-hydroxylacyl-ACP dehydratase [Xanthomonadales bacterium PRO6]
MDASAVPIVELLPHAPPMVLLDRVVAAGGEHLSAEVAIRADSEFCREGRVGAWVGIEYMAQAVAAWSGWQARMRGEPVKIGYLLGTRRYDAHVPEFLVGDVLQVHVEREFQADNGLARFRAEIHRGDECCATASISVYEPPAD